MRVEQLIELGDHLVPSVRYQIAHLRHPELLHLQAERLLVAERRHMVLHEEDESLVELVVLGLHVLGVDLDAENVLVEGAREVALEQLIVVDRFGCWPQRKKKQKHKLSDKNSKREENRAKSSLTDHSTDELEVEQVIGVGVAGRIYHIRHAIAGRHREQGVHRIEDLARYDDVPLAQQTAGVLALFICSMFEE